MSLQDTIMRSALRWIVAPVAEPVDEPMASLHPEALEGSVNSFFGVSVGWWLNCHIPHSALLANSRHGPSLDVVEGLTNVFTWKCS